jgi:hypothetical protein
MIRNVSLINGQTDRLALPYCSVCDVHPDTHGYSEENTYILEKEGCKMRITDL